MSISPIIFLLLANAAPAATDAVERCRAAYQADPAAHIACLEDALRQQPIASSADEIGREQVEARERARDGGPAPIALQIVSVSYDARERGTFKTADGQVWRETELLERRPRLSTSKQYAARIERGVVGGYRLYVDGIRWMYKVERLE